MCLRGRLQRPGTSPGGPATWTDCFLLLFPQEKCSGALSCSGLGRIPDPGPVGALAALAGGSGLRPRVHWEGLGEGRYLFKEVGAGASHSGSVWPGSGPGTAPSGPLHPSPRAGRALHLDTLVRTGACYFLPRRSELQPPEMSPPSKARDPVSRLRWPSDPAPQSTPCHGCQSRGRGHSGLPWGNSKLCPVAVRAWEERERKEHPAAPESGGMF